MKPKAKPKATLAALRAEHDVFTVTRRKVNAQFERLKARGDEFQYERDFCLEATISPVHLRLVKGEFAAHTMTLRRIGKKASLEVWFPNPKHCAAIRKEQEATRQQFSGPLEE